MHAFNRHQRGFEVAHDLPERVVTKDRVYDVCRTRQAERVKPSKAMAFVTRPRPKRKQGVLACAPTRLLRPSPRFTSWRRSGMVAARRSLAPLLSLDLPGIPKVKSGKVREVFDLGDRLLFVATDRISAFDCVMPNGIPRKGEVLTQMSHFWFDRTELWLPNHRVGRADDPLPK